MGVPGFCALPAPSRDQEKGPSEPNQHAGPGVCHHPPDLRKRAPRRTRGAHSPAGCDLRGPRAPGVAAIRHAA